MKTTIETLTEETNDNADILIEYLKMVIERLDEILGHIKKSN